MDTVARMGEKSATKTTPNKRKMIRGGSANEKRDKIDITSTFRIDVSADIKEKNLGFRLVKPG